MKKEEIMEKRVISVGEYEMIAMTVFVALLISILLEFPFKVQLILLVIYIATEFTIMRDMLRCANKGKR
jgi:hypothetical protein